MSHVDTRDEGVAPAPPQSSAEWAADAFRRVDELNADPEATLESSGFAATLESAPTGLRAQVRLTQQDLAKLDGDDPLLNLRSDSVADDTRIVNDDSTHNLVLGRMTVPGGPRPGAYALEGVLFTARPARMPEFFPELPDEHALDFGTLVSQTSGFGSGDGCVVFPEQLSVRVRSGTQSFGVVFIDKLSQLFAERVLPRLSAASRDLVTQSGKLEDVRELAFLAHEWGHLISPASQDEVILRRRRVAAVLNEYYADLQALAMLAKLGADGVGAAVVLIADRVVREARLLHRHRQVDAIAGQMLLVTAVRSGLCDTAADGIDVRADGSFELIEQEIRAVAEVEARASYDHIEPLEQFMRDRGWEIDENNGFTLRAQARDRRPGDLTPAEPEAS